MKINFRNSAAKDLKSFRAIAKENGGRIPVELNEAKKESFANYTKYTKFVEDNLGNMISDLRLLRSGTSDKAPIDFTLGEYAEELFGIEAPKSRSSFNFLHSLNIDTSKSISSLYAEQRTVRGAADLLVPEIVVDAIRMGIEANSLDALTAHTYNVNGLSINMPSAKSGNFAPKIIGEAERIPMGVISFINKTVNIEKFGIGVGITDEVRDYTAIDMLAEQLSGVGREFLLKQNAFLIETLLNGEQADLSYSAPLVGVTTPNTLAYLDIRRLLTRTFNLGTSSDYVLGREDELNKLATLNEVTGSGFLGGQPLLRVDMAGTDMLKAIPHGLIPDDTLLFVNSKKAIAKLVAKALQTEEARLTENQLTNIFVTESIGFAKLWRDAVVKLDASVDVAVSDFPDWMDIEAKQAESFRKKF